MSHKIQYLRNSDQFYFLGNIKFLLKETEKKPLKDVTFSKLSPKTLQSGTPHLYPIFWIQLGLNHKFFN